MPYDPLMLDGDALPKSPDQAESAASNPLRQSIGRLIRRARVIVTHAPLSLAAAGVVLIAGIASGTLWQSIQLKAWFDDVAYGVPAFREGQWWTVLSGTVFGLTPAQVVSILVLAVTVLAWSEWRLGTLRTALVMLLSQVLGVLATALFAWALSDSVISGIHWQWPTHLATIRDVGMTTAIVGAVTAATATLRSPWRLRMRLVIVAYVALSLLFRGSFADVSHLVAFAVMLPAGERLFSTAEHGFAPRTRREVRLLGFSGLIVIAAAAVLVWFFPGSGPLGPTDSEDSSIWAMWIHVGVIVFVALGLRRGRRWAWWVTVVFGLLNVVGLIVTVVLLLTTDFVPQGGVTLGTSILWLAEVAILFSGRFAFRGRLRVPATDGPGAPLAKDLIRNYGGGTMSWMTIWPGNHYLFDDVDAPSTVVAYQRHAGTMIALTDPVGPPELLDQSVREFTKFAEASGLTPCWFSIDAETAASAERMGWRTAQIAEDAIVDLPGLAFKGKPWQHVRTAMNKAKKEGLRHRLVRLADEPFSVRAQVQAISEEWVGDKGLPEMGFTLGGVDEALDPETVVSLAVDGDGSVHGVLSWLPVYGRHGVVQGWTLDVMRRRSDGFGPVIEFMLGSAFLEFQAQGALFASLSGAPLASSTGEVSASATDRLLDALGGALEPFYGFRSLHAFKKKFQPRYQGVYLAFRDEADLPRIGIAISRAYLPDATPRQLAQLAMSAER